MTDIDALHARFTARLRALPPPSSPSARTPQYSTHNNNVDNIERHLYQDGHTQWGFVIYRCTYINDADWAEFMRRLSYRTRETLQTFNGLDMLDRLIPFTVIEDREVLNGASPGDVRTYFKQWVEASAPQAEQCPGASARLSQRYRYCLHIDEVALEAIVRDAPAPPEIDATMKGWVNLVSKDCDDEKQKEEEPLEGNARYGVGWMRVAYQCVMVDMYALLRDMNAWYIEYRRPPEVACA